MKPGDRVQFLDQNGLPRVTCVRVFYFRGTSRYLPSPDPSPWRELLVFETDKGAVVIRDRERMAVGKERPESLVAWHVIENVETPLVAAQALLDDLAGKAKSEEFQRLYQRAVRELGHYTNTRAVEA